MAGNVERHRIVRGVLSLDPRIRRIGFAYFAGNHLLESGIKNIRQETPRRRVKQFLIPALVKMLDKFGPDVVLVPDVRPHSVRRSKYVVETVNAVIQEASNRDTAVYFVTDEEVNNTFMNQRGNLSPNRHDVYVAIVERFPELSVYMPRIRRIWDPEPYAAPMFHAVAMHCAWVNRAHTGLSPTRT